MSYDCKVLKFKNILKKQGEYIDNILAYMFNSRSLNFKIETDENTIFTVDLLFIKTNNISMV